MSKGVTHLKANSLYTEHTKMTLTWIVLSNSQQDSKQSNPQKVRITRHHWDYNNILQTTSDEVNVEFYLLYLIHDWANVTKSTHPHA